MTRKLLVAVIACVFATQACTSTSSRAPQHSHPTTVPLDVVYGKGSNDTIWVNPPPSPDFLPTGMTHHTYFSKSMGHDVGYCIYLPPGYSKHPQQRFPVIYNLHGINRNELHGMLNAQVLDEGIRAGRWPDLIMVFPNGGSRSFYMDWPDTSPRVMAETTIIRELIPHVDQTYRTIASRDGRCIEGFSMGGLGAMYLALKYPDMFCSLFSQAGNARKAPDKPDSFALLQQNLEQLKGKLRMQIFCGTQDKNHLPSLREFHQTLIAAGYDHTYLEIEGLAHDLPKMIELYRRVWYDYQVESLRRSGALQTAGNMP